MTTATMSAQRVARSMIVWLNTMLGISAATRVRAVRCGLFLPKSSIGSPMPSPLNDKSKGGVEPKKRRSYGAKCRCFRNWRVAGKPAVEPLTHSSFETALQASSGRGNCRAPRSPFETAAKRRPPQGEAVFKNMSFAAPYLRSSVIAKSLPSGLNGSPAATSTTIRAFGAIQPCLSNAASAGAANPLR